MIYRLYRSSLLTESGLDDVSCTLSFPNMESHLIIIEEDGLRLGKALNISVMTNAYLIDLEASGLRVQDCIGLRLIDGEYQIYWTDGNRTIYEHTYTADKNLAERKLKEAVFRFRWMKEARPGARYAVKALRHVSNKELVEIERQIQIEFARRGIHGELVNDTFNERYVADFIDRNFERIDYCDGDDELDEEKAM